MRPVCRPMSELTVAEGGDPGYLADYIAQHIPVDVAAKQEILEEHWHVPAAPGDR